MGVPITFLDNYNPDQFETRFRIYLAIHRTLSPQGPVFYPQNTPFPDLRQSHTEYITKIKGIEGGKQNEGKNKVGECGG